MAYASPVPVTKHDLVLRQMRDERTTAHVAKYTPADVCRMVGVTSSTLRRWSADFSRYLSPNAGKLTGEHRHRRYTDDDLRVLTGIRYLMGNGHSRWFIGQMLASARRHRAGGAS